MNISDALALFDEMRKYAGDSGLQCLIVGSVGYRSALIHNEMLEVCDDADCVFVYDNIKQLSGSPYLSEKLILTAEDKIERKTADMLSTKLYRYGIQVSADFVSMDYLSAIAAEPYEGISKYRVKLTDAVEKDTNIYCDFYGNKTVYHKECKEYGGYRTYKLPIHLYDNGALFPGVLLNKLIYNPYPLAADNRLMNVIRDIGTGLNSQCPPGGDIALTSYRNEQFSEETAEFMKGMT